MAALNDLIADVRPLLAHSVADETWEWAIRKAAREFCAFSRWLRETYPMDLVANEPYYPITPNTPDTEIVKVKAVQIGDFPLNSTAFESVEPESGDACNFIFEPPNRLWLNPTPTADRAGGSRVRLILQPTITAMTLPDMLVQRWREAITKHALGDIYLMDGSPWFNPQMAMSWKAAYAIEARKARDEADRGHRSRQFRTSPVSWAGR